jgi:septal ring factor EnvC (AmiA/AmiB activator)
MDLAIIIALISLLATPLAAVVTWFFNRRKYNTEIYNTISESAQTSVETVQLAMNTLREELKDTQLKIANLNTNVQELTIETMKLKQALAESEREKASLKERIYMLTASLQAQAVERNEYI